MEIHTELKEELKESLMRKDYRENLEEHKKYMNLYKSKYDEINTKYFTSLNKIKVWKKRFFLNIFIFTIGFLFVSFILYVTDLFKSSSLFFLVLAIVCGVLNACVYLFLVFTDKAMCKEIDQQQNALKTEYYDFAIIKLKKASSLVIDLMIEEERGEETSKYKASHNEYEYEEYMFALRRYYAYHIKEQYKEINPSTLVNFYNEWHSIRTGESNRLISHEERLALAFAKTKLYANK